MYLLFFCMSAIGVWQLTKALYTGVVHLKGPDIDVTQEPFWYWVETACWAAIAIAPWHSAYRLYCIINEDKQKKR